MNIDVGGVFNGIVGELGKRRRVGESMSELIDVCEASHAHRDWALFRNLPYDDLGALCGWVQGIFREWPNESLRGLWFGLFNPIGDGGETLADLHVCGSKKFDPDDLDWAAQVGWRPSALYAKSAVLGEIYRIAHSPGGLALDAEYPLCLGYAAIAMSKVLGEVSTIPAAVGAEPVGVAVGFDDGDFIVVGELSERGSAAALGT